MVLHVPLGSSSGRIATTNDANTTCFTNSKKTSLGVPLLPIFYSIWNLPTKGQPKKRTKKTTDNHNPPPKKKQTNKQTNILRKIHREFEPSQTNQPTSTDGKPPEAWRSATASNNACQSGGRMFHASSSDGSMDQLPRENPAALVPLEKLSNSKTPAGPFHTTSITGDVWVFKKKLVFSSLQVLLRNKLYKSDPWCLVFGLFINFHVGCSVVCGNDPKHGSLVIFDAHPESNAVLAAFTLLAKSSMPKRWLINDCVKGTNSFLCFLRLLWLKRHLSNWG